MGLNSGLKIIFQQTKEPNIYQLLIKRKKIPPTAGTVSGTNINVSRKTQLKLQSDEIPTGIGAFRLPYFSKNMGQFKMAIYKRGKVWYARLYWRDRTNRRHSKSKGGFKTKNEASGILHVCGGDPE